MLISVDASNINVNTFRRHYPICPKYKHNILIDRLIHSLTIMFIISKIPNLYEKVKQKTL